MKASIFLTIVLFSINVLQPKKYLIEVADKEKSSRKTVEPLADDDNSVAEESKTSVRTSKSSRITQVQSMLPRPDRTTQDPLEVSGLGGKGSYTKSKKYLIEVADKEKSSRKTVEKSSRITGETAESKITDMRLKNKTS